MIILIDTRQKDVFHNEQIERYINGRGIETIHTKLLCGDYVIANKQNISVDSKASIHELYQDLVTEHDRFRREMQTAQRCGIKLYIVVPNNDGITCVDDLLKWKNPQVVYRTNNRNEIETKKPPVPNEQLIRMIKTMSGKYGCKFVFCPKGKTGEVIVDLLVQNQIENSF